MMRTPLFFAASAWLLVSCATTQVEPEPRKLQDSIPMAEAAEPTAQAVPPKQLDAELLDRLLVAEIAGQRGQLHVAVANYLAAAEMAQDPRVAERATRIAVYARDTESALHAGQLWVKLAPENVDARQVVAALLVRKGRSQEAIQHFEKILHSGKLGEQKSYLLVASLLSKEKDKQAAMDVMEKLMVGRQDNPYAQYAYSNLAYLVGENRKAEAAIDKVLEQRPDWTEAHILRSNILTRDERGEQAMEDLKRAVGEYSENHTLRLFYARKLVDGRQLKAAYEQFSILLDQVPESEDARYALALLSLQLNKLDEAEAQLQELVTRGQRVNEAKYYLGQVAEQRHDYDAAMQLYEQVRGGQYEAEAEIRIAVLLATEGNVDQARDRLQAIQAGSSEMALRLYLAEGEILREAGQYEEALEVYSEALVEIPDDVQLLYARALMAEELDKVDLSIQDLRKILELQPDNAQALNALGYTLADRTDQLEEAMELIQRAYKMHPDDAAITDSLGWAYYRMGDYPKAIKYLRKAFDKLKDPEIAAHLGEVLWVSGDKAAARDVWNEALHDTPEDPFLLDVIKRLTE